MARTEIKRTLSASHQQAIHKLHQTKSLRHYRPSNDNFTSHQMVCTCFFTAIFHRYFSIDIFQNAKVA